jgi:hypothetical protein
MQPVEISLGLKNSGPSTAFLRAATVRNTLTFPGLALPAEPRYGEPHVAAAAIISGSEIPYVVTMGQRHNQFDLDVLNSGQRFLNIYGFIAYDDDYSWLFGRRTIGFCFVYLPKAGPRHFASCKESRYPYSR